MEDSLKQYLVKIGWKLDESGLQRSNEKVTSTLEGWRKLIHGIRHTTLKNATSFALSAVAAITGSVINLTQALAEQDLEMQKQAMHWFTTTEKARAFQGALDQLNISYSDLFWTTKEQLQQFTELYELGKSLEPPAALQETMKDVRAITQEFRKFSTIFNYFVRYIGYFVSQYSSGEIQYWLKTLRELNKTFSNKMVDIAQKIGKALSFVLTVASGVAKGLKSAWDWMSRIVEYISNIPGSLTAISTAISIFLLGPLGRVITAITMIALLIEDFMYWKAGKKSVFGELFGDYSSSSFVKDFSKSIGDLEESIKGVFDKLKEIGAFDFVNSSLLKGLKLLVETVGVLVKGLNYLLKIASGKINLEDIEKKAEGMSQEEIWNIIRSIEGRPVEDYLSSMSTTPVTNSAIYNQGNVQVDSHDVITVASAKEAAEYKRNKTIDNFMESYNSRLDYSFVR